MLPNSKPAPAKRSDDPYARKYELLKDRYKRFFNSNDRLRNRIYNVKKEIKNLKRLKRVLVQRLLGYGDRFMDVCLEIPDSEGGGEDKCVDHGDLTVPSPAPTPPSRKRYRNPPLPHPSSIPTLRFEMFEEEFDELVEKTKISMMDLIDSVVTETRQERLAQQAAAQANSSCGEVETAPNEPGVEDTSVQSESLITSSPRNI